MPRNNIRQDSKISLHLFLSTVVLLCWFGFGKLQQSMLHRPLNKINCKASVSGLSVFVYGSAHLMLPRIVVIVRTAPTSNLDWKQAAAPRVERSTELLCVDNDVNRSLESTHIWIPKSKLSSSLQAWATVLASPAPYEDAEVSAAGTYFTGRLELLESHDTGWQIESLLNFPISGPVSTPTWLWSLGLTSSAITSTASSYSVESDGLGYEL